jgi:hypothetical protein
VALNLCRISLRRHSSDLLSRTPTLPLLPPPSQAAMEDILPPAQPPLRPPAPAAVAAPLSLKTRGFLRWRSMGGDVAPVEEIGWHGFLVGA